MSGERSQNGSIQGLLQLRRLEELHITSSDITNLQIADFIRISGPRLQYLQCNACPNITPDVIELAESRGIVMVLEEYSAQ